MIVQIHPMCNRRPNCQNSPGVCSAGQFSEVASSPVPLTLQNGRAGPPGQRSQRTAATLAVLAAMVLGALAPTPTAAQSYDPAYHFRTINTTHFAIHFHQGEESDAEFLAVEAEETWRALRDALHISPPALTNVILVDQTEDANGWATPTPRPTVMVTAAWPSGVEFIGSTESWLRLVFTHEFTHIVHLEQSRSWATVVRRVFGRVPLAFPNTLLPTWQIEGLATLCGECADAIEEALRQGRPI